MKVSHGNLECRLYTYCASGSRECARRKPDYHCIHICLVALRQKFKREIRLGNNWSACTRLEGYNTSYIIPYKVRTVQLCLLYQISDENCCSKLWAKSNISANKESIDSHPRQLYPLPPGLIKYLKTSVLYAVYCQHPLDICQGCCYIYPAAHEISPCNTNRFEISVVLPLRTLGKKTMAKRLSMPSYLLIQVKELERPLRLICDNGSDCNKRPLIQ